MDTYHHHSYMIPPQQQPQPPPPPPTADPNLYHLQHPRPLPPQNFWYSNHQFHYHQPPPPLPSSHSPSPPPPQQHNWAPPPPPPQQQQQPPPLYSLPPLSHTYPSRFPPLPPRPPHAPQILHPYPPVNQEWSNPNWGHQHQGWDYPVPAHNNAEDWAARARAWAEAKKVTTEDQHSQSQYPQVVKTEEQGWFHDQHFQGADSHYQDVQQQPFPAPGYREFPVTAAPSHQLPVAYPQETASFNSGPSSYIADEHQSYLYAGGDSAGASTTSPSVHRQEVPSSYSSVTGKDDHKEQLYNSLPLPGSTAHGQHNVQLSPPVFSKSVLNDHSFAYGDQAAEARIDPRDQPLDFVSSYSTHHESTGAVRGTGPATSMPSISSWTAGVATGSLYLPIPPVLPSEPQHDPSIPLPSPITGNAAPPFGSYPSVSSFQQAIPSAPSFGVAAGTAFHPTTGFPGDAYGVSNVSDRPKKASVPNWLKEEIIKNASVITRPSADHPKEEVESIEDEGVEKSFSKGNQADSKSIDSPQSPEEEEDDEDYVDAARTAVINQEIKRILTEVLSKVTDELFDEIATKVLDEADPVVGVEHNAESTDQKTSPSPPAVPTPKASAKTLVPAEAKETKNEDGDKKSISGSAGNLLGLASYATDEDEDDDDDEIHGSSMSSCRENAGQHVSILKLSEEMHGAAENDSSQVELGNSRQGLTKASAVVVKHDLSSMVPQTSNVEISVNGGKAIDRTIEYQLEAAHRVNTIKKSDPNGQDASVEKLMTDISLDRTAKMRSSESYKSGPKNNDVGKGSVCETESSRADVREDVKRRRQDEKKLSKSERTEDANGLKDRMKEQGVDKMKEKAKELESRKRTSQNNVKEDQKEEKLWRASAKEDANRIVARTKDKEEDRVRHKHTSDSSRYKRGHSPPIVSRGEKSKANDLSDEASDDSKREPISRKRHSSPSPDRSKRRHVSRSPHSKHSQRRHSPYSSLEASRGQRSRFKSPARRQR